MQETICCFTGHRPQSLPWGWNEADPRCEALKRRLQDEILALNLRRGVTRFLSGMAQGVDTWCAELVLELREAYPVSLECVVPFAGQAAGWREAGQERRQRILERCDAVVTLQTAYTPGCYQRRNRYMVEHSGFVLAVWDGSPGGTGSTVACARRLGRELLILAP